MHACIHIHLFECKPKRPYSRHLYIHCIISTVQWIPWCGLLINTKTLDMQADFSRYVGKGLCLCTCDALDQHIYIYTCRYQRQHDNCVPFKTFTEPQAEDHTVCIMHSMYCVHIHVDELLALYRAVKLKCHPLLLDSDVRCQSL